MRRQAAASVQLDSPGGAQDRGLRPAKDYRWSAIVAGIGGNSAPFSMAPVSANWGAPAQNLVHCR
jgi:hypothetical protein